MIVLRDRDGGALRPAVLSIGYPPKTGILQWSVAAVLAGIVGISAVQIVGACGVLSPMFGWRIATCPVSVAHEPDSRLEAVFGRQAVLEEQVTSLERQLARLECPPYLRREPASPESVEPESTGGLNAEQWEEQDVRLLVGCWDLDSDYQTQNVETGEISEVASLNTCFDANGVGNQALRYENGTTCQSGTTARFNALGQLEISDDSDMNCSDRSSIFKQVRTCNLEPDGTATCTIVTPGYAGGPYSPVRIKAR